MTRQYWKWSLLAAVAFITAACTGIPRRHRDQEALEQYLQYAGPPVDHITYLGNYSGWSAVGQYQVVLWTGINDAYLVTVNPPCENLRFANRIVITPTANTLYSRFDAIRVRGWRCQIAEIRPIDSRKMRQDQREQRAREKAEKTQQK